MPRGPIERSLNGGANLTFNGQTKFADGTAAAPSITFASDTDTGLFRIRSGQIGVAVNSESIGGFTVAGAGLISGIGMNSGAALYWGNTGTFSSSGAVSAAVYLDAANTLAQRNGVNAQAIRLYGTYTDASNYERLHMEFNSGAFRLYSAAAGTGSNRPLIFGTAATGRWEINTSGHWLAVADNTYDIGASGATRPRNVYVGGFIVAGDALQVGAASYFDWGGTRSRIYSPSDGVLRLSNAAQTDFSSLQFGGTTDSFPALVRNGAELQVKTAANGDLSFIADKYRRSGSGSPEGVVGAPVGTIYHRTDGGAGTSFYIKESGVGNTGWVAK